MKMKGVSFNISHFEFFKNYMLNARFLKEVLISHFYQHKNFLSTFHKIDRQLFCWLRPQAQIQAFYLCKLCSTATNVF